MENDKILKELEGTNLAERLDIMKKLYEKLESAQNLFQEKFRIHCKEGCGTCCEHFNPDITPLESDYLAYGLILEGRDSDVLKLLHSESENPGGCPLYRKNSVFHCSVYKWRPMICRLFGASAVTAKDGHAAFRNCKWNTGTKEVSSSALEKNRDSVVIMGDYGRELNENQPGETDTLPLAQALENSIYKIRFLLMLKSYDETPAPEPQAS
ncbi:MAG: YkgJ family cysteine cluster protein [Sphaerochaeta sp.]